MSSFSNQLLAAFAAIMIMAGSFGAAIIGPPAHAAIIGLAQA